MEKMEILHMCACFALVAGPCRVTVLGIHAGACMVVCRRAARCFPAVYTLKLDEKMEILQMCACFALVTGPCRVTELRVHDGACMVVCRRASRCFSVLYTLKLDGKNGDYAHVCLWCVCSSASPGTSRVPLEQFLVDMLTDMHF